MSPYSREIPIFLNLIDLLVNLLLDELSHSDGYVFVGISLVLLDFFEHLVYLDFALLLELLLELVFVGAFGHCLDPAGDLGFVDCAHTGFFSHELVDDLV